MHRFFSFAFLLGIAASASAQLSVSGSSCTTDGIQSAITTVASSGGGAVSVFCPSSYDDKTGKWTTVGITSNLWETVTVSHTTVTAPTKVVFGPGTFLFSAQQILPDNTEVSGSGRGTIFQISGSASFDTAFDNGLFTNVHNTGAYKQSMNIGITLHDFQIDGTPNHRNSAGVSFYNIEDSSIFGLYIQNVWLSGIDLRNASGVNVHDNWCVGCATHGAPQHAFGGGVNALNDSFVYNKFVANHATGGGKGADQFDFFGQDLSGKVANKRCGFNVIADNTSDSAPTVGIFLDTCNHNTVTGNIIRNAGTDGIACTSGRFNLDGGCAYNNFSNQIQSPGRNGYHFSNAYENVVTGGEIYASGEEAILLNAAVRNKIENVSIYSPSQSEVQKYCGVTINVDRSGAHSVENTIQNNTLSDMNMQLGPQGKMKAGICITTTGTGSFSKITNNVVQNNHINGGGAGTSGDGVADGGEHNFVACNAYGNAGTTFNCVVQRK